MASAYDASGRLKKHALLGTSLAADPTRTAERKRYESLHEEAKGFAGQGRAPMLTQLQSRWQEYGSGQQKRLQKIADLKGGFEEEYADVVRPDPKEESRFAAYDKYIEEEGFKKKKVAGLKRKGVPADFLSEAREQYRADKKQYRSERTAARRTEKAGFDPGPAPVKPGLRGRYVKSQWEERYGGAGEQAYRDQITAEVDKINQQYIPLQEEEFERQERLANRVDLYNLFLGE